MSVFMCYKEKGGVGGVRDIDAKKVSVSAILLAGARVRGRIESQRLHMSHFAHMCG